MQVVVALVEAFTLMSVSRVCLAVFPVKRIVWAITRSTIKQGTSETNFHPLPASAKTAIWAIKTVASRSAVKFVCFPQSIAGYWMLRRRNIASTIVYGVRRDEDKLISHTWLKCGGKALIGEGQEHEFSVIAEWP